MNKKHQQNKSCACKCKSDRKNVIQIHGGTMINDVSVKNIIYLNKIIFGILPHVVSHKNIKYLASIIDDSVIICDKKLFKKKQKHLQQISMKKMQSVKKIFPYFPCLFIYYHCIIDSC